MRGFAFVLLLSAIAPVVAQEKSVRPGINDPFEKPMPEEFVERFEREGRDAFDHRHAVVEACRLKPGMVVADIGAGTGLFTRLFAPHVAPGGKVYAVDIAEEFVKHTVRSAQAAGMKNVEGIVCTADSVNLPPQSIDLAFICDTYHHFEFPHKTMRSLHAALKPEGAVILIDFHRIEGVSSPWILSHVRAGQEVFSKEIVAAGFRQVEERKNLLQESYFVRFEKVQRAAPDKPLVPLPEKVSEPCDNPSSPESVELGKAAVLRFPALERQYDELWHAPSAGKSIWRPIAGRAWSRWQDIVVQYALASLCRDSTVGRAFCGVTNRQRFQSHSTEVASAPPSSAP